MFLYRFIMMIQVSFAIRMGYVAEKLRSANSKQNVQNLGYNYPLNVLFPSNLLFSHAFWGRCYKHFWTPSLGD